MSILDLKNNEHKNKSDKCFNVAFLSNVFFPVTNGVVHSLHLLAKGLKKLNTNTFLITSKHPNFNEEVIRKYHVDYEVILLPSIYFKKIDYCIPNPLSIFFIDKFISNRKIDILQLNHPFFIYNISKKIKKMNKNLRKVFVFHTQYDVYHNYVKFIPYEIYNKFIWSHLNEVISEVDVVVVPSKSMISKIKDNVSNKYYQKLIYISNPVDIDFINSNIDFNKVNYLKEYYKLKDKFVLGFVGRIEKEKNIETLLEFFVKNFKDYNNIVLLIVGGGSILEILKNKYSTFENVIFTGKIPHEEVGIYYKLMDIFISLSLTEVKPLTYIEALASAIPVIAFKTIGADDLVINGYNGFLVEYSQNYQRELLKLILSLINNNELLSDLRKNALNSAKEYHYLKISEKYLNLYNELRKNY
jgi:1,2-diacylglycerol 3-alpha-glucosyltransferase